MASSGRVEVGYEVPAGVSKMKFKCGADQLVPVVPAEEEWFRAPFLQGDTFWDQKILFASKSKSRDSFCLLGSDAENEVHIPSSSVPRLNIERGEYPYSFCHFLNYVAPFEGMEPWSDWILSQAGFRRILKKADIFEAIRNSSELRVSRNTLAVEALLSRWSTFTHTFITSYGEIAPTLEDVAALMSLPTWGEENIILTTETPEERTIMDALLMANSSQNNLGTYFDKDGKRKAERSVAHSKSTFKGWMRYWWKDYADPRGGTGEYVDGPGLNSPYHLAAYLAAWLSRHIFEGPPADGVRSHVFRIASALSLGKKVPLGPLFLGTLFHRLDLINKGMRRSVGRYDIPSYIATPFLQMWLFERFRKFAPKPHHFSGIDNTSTAQENPRVPRSARWSGAGLGKKLSPVIDRVEEFCWRPYSEPLIGVQPMSWYFTEDIVIDASYPNTVNPSIYLWVAWIAPKSLPALTDDGYASVGYSPHRVARQFGFDQCSPCRVETKVQSESLSQFLSKNQHALLANSNLHILPSATREGTWSFTGGNWWYHQLQLFERYVRDVPKAIKVPCVLRDDPLLSPVKGVHSRGSVISRFIKTLGIIPGTATNGIPTGATLIAAEDEESSLHTLSHSAEIPKKGTATSKKRGKKTLDRSSSSSRRKGSLSKRIKTYDSDEDTAQDTIAPELSVSDDSRKSSPVKGQEKVSEFTPATGLITPQLTHEMIIEECPTIIIHSPAPSIQPPASKESIDMPRLTSPFAAADPASASHGESTDTDSDRDVLPSRIKTRLQPESSRMSRSNSSDSEEVSSKDSASSKSHDASGLACQGTLKTSLDSPPITSAGNTIPIECSPIPFQSERAALTLSEAIPSIAQGFSSMVSFPDVSNCQTNKGVTSNLSSAPSLSVPLPIAAPSVAPSIIVTTRNSTRTAPASSVLPSKEELFDGVAPVFLPFLYELYEYRGHMFDGTINQPRFVRVMNFQFLGALLQSLDEKPLGMLTLEEINSLGQGLNAVRFGRIDVRWLEANFQEARRSIQASQTRKELEKIQQEIDKTEEFLRRLKNDREKLSDHAKALENLNAAAWASDQSIFRNMLH